MTFVKFEHYVKLFNILHSRIYGSMNLSYIFSLLSHTNSQKSLKYTYPRKTSQILNYSNLLSHQKQANNLAKVIE